MSDMSFLEAYHQRTEFRQAQPLRHLAAQDPAFGFTSRCASFTGDDKHERQSLAVGAMQKA